jgi:hypothetical protein
VTHQARRARGGGGRADDGGGRALRRRVDAAPVPASGNKNLGVNRDGMRIWAWEGGFRRVSGVARSPNVAPSGRSSSSPHTPPHL